MIAPGPPESLPKSEPSPLLDGAGVSPAYHDKLNAGDRPAFIGFDGKRLYP